MGKKWGMIMLNHKIILKWMITIGLIISSIIPIQAKETTIQQIIDNMTLRQKITQTFMMDFTSWNGKSLTTMNDELYAILEEYDFGGIILFAANVQDTKSTYDLVCSMQEAATKDGGIPMIISTDQEGGIVARLGSGTTLSGNMSLGATNYEESSKETGEIIGQELSVLGINTTLAPVVDINNNANNPVIGLRSYGDDPELVSSMASAFIDGLNEYNIISCAKHFPGHGDTSTDSHYGLPLVDKTYDELVETELAPYFDLVDQVDMIMTAHILYPELDDSTIYSNKTKKEESRPATLSYEIITNLLKKKMGFLGVVCSDALNMSGITNTFDEAQAVVEALNAGIDLICMPASGISSKAQMSRVDNIIKAVEEAIDTGYLSEERLDDAVTRILSMKSNRGILEYNGNNYSIEDASNLVGSKENARKAKENACKAVTVITNKEDTLPLKIQEDSKVLFVYPYANQKDRMIAGWETAKEAGLIPEGAQMQTYQYYRTNYEIIGTLRNALKWANIVIVNSEVSSDNSMLYTTWTSAGPNTIVNYCHKNGKKAIVMSIDKPYDVQLYENADAILAVYGNTINITAGIEVVLGVHSAMGTLPLDIPIFDNEQGIYTEEVLFEKGFGIYYSSLLQPDPTTILEASNTNEGIQISWKEIEDATSYQVYCNDELVYEGVSTSYLDTKANQNGQEYHYIVYVVNEKGTSDPSNEVISYYLSAPQIKVKNKLFSKINISWDLNTDANGIEIQYTTNNTTHTITILNDSTNSFLLEGIRKNTYSIQIRSYYSIDGNTYYSPYSTTKTIKANQFIWF